jgi:hypothetical protein
MMAMLVEAYGAEGAIALSKECPLQFLDSLLCQTVELRRNPEDREEEEREQAIKEWKQRNQGRSISFTGPAGETRHFTVGSGLLARMNNGFTGRDTNSNNSNGGSN